MSVPTREAKVSVERSPLNPSQGAADHTRFRTLASRTLLLLSITFSLIFLLSGPAADKWPIFKVGSIALLALLGFRVNSLLGIALALGAFGDLLLGVTQLGRLNAEQLFLLGLVAFLIGHLVYIMMFWRLVRAKLTPPRALAILAVIVALSSMLSLLYRSLGPLLVPVFVYAIVLAGMAISAQLAQLGNPLAAIGALFFVASDAMLAISKFHSPFAGNSELIWLTYYLAQFLICLGVARAISMSKRIGLSPP